MSRKTHRASAIASTPILDAARLKAIYTTMLRLRALKQGTRLRSTGPAAVLAGVLSQLRENDAAGGLSSEVLEALFGNNAPHWIPDVRESIGRLQIAHGVALASKSARQDGVVAVFCSGLVLNRELDRVLAYAGAQMLPVLYVVQQGPERPRKRGWKQTFPSIPVDMHDAIAVYRVAYESIQRARNGGGPTWMECKPWQVRARLRDAAGTSGESSPVVKLENYIAARGFDPEKWKSVTPGKRYDS